MPDGFLIFVGMFVYIGFNVYVISSICSTKGYKVKPIKMQVAIFIACLLFGPVMFALKYIAIFRVCLAERAELKKLKEMVIEED
jgi:hypothetical protein